MEEVVLVFLKDLMGLACGKTSEMVGLNLLCKHSLGVGDGSKVLFWKDQWTGNGTFIDKYPELFRFARDKDAMVSDSM